MDRSNEIRNLFTYSVDELIKKSDARLKVYPILDELYEYLADFMVNEFQQTLERNETKAFIMPVGPTQPYPLMARKINARGISLKNCLFFIMDEYCDDNDIPLPESHPLSLKGQILNLFFRHINPELMIPGKNLIYPTRENIRNIPEMIEEAGGIEVCYGGIGIHGHVAFNEPEPGVKETGPRMVTINEFTRTVGAVRYGLGGNLINFPRRGITLGMKQILNSRKLLLMTRNEYKDMDWANTVLRLAVLGVPGDDYPVTHIRNHKNYIIATDRATASAPRFVI